MNDKQQSDVIRKIKACLARADAERNANEHERATALRQANALMDSAIKINDIPIILLNLRLLRLRVK